ncbi:MAG: hypothetical protein ACYDEU_07685 [Vulcanimicrobiaceae bacterium]
MREAFELEFSRFITACGHRPRSAIRLPGPSGAVTLCLACWHEGKYVRNGVPGRRA